MAIERSRNEHFFGACGDQLDEDFASLMARLRGSSAPERQTHLQNAFSIDVEERDEVVIVKAGSNRDVTFTYPKDDPLKVVATGVGVRPQILKYAKVLFQATVAVELWQPYRAQDPSISRIFEQLRSAAGFKLADEGRIDLVNAGRQVSWLPGIDIDSVKR